MSSRAGVREDTGLSSGDREKKDPLMLGSNGLCLERYLHLEASLKKKEPGVAGSRNLTN